MYPVFHILGFSDWLMSIGEWLKNSYTLEATEDVMSIWKKTGEDALSLFPWLPGDTIFLFCCTLIKESVWIISMSTIHSVDYNLIHCQMGHPSHDMLKQVSKNTQGFPSGILILTDLPICQGCAQGKMHLNVFPNSQSCATSPFALIHSDLKELPVLSYHWYKFFITFLVDFTSYCWISLLQKSDAIDSFLTLVKNKYQTTVKEFMTDASSEYKSLELQDKLRKQGIMIRMSIPHMHQQNGHAEHLNRTLI